MPKLIGIGYFNATSKGIADAAKELGNVDAKTDGPTKANIDEQITFIDNYITSGVDGILFAANDPVAIAPVLKKALGKGINVVGYDANSTPDARAMVRQPGRSSTASPRRMIDNMAKEIGEDGSFAIVTSTFTTPNQARWIAEMAAYAGEVPSEDEVAGDGRGPGGQHPLLQPGDDAHQQVRRRAEGHLRHDLGGDAGLGRSRHPGRQVRQDRRRRPRHPERDEALCRRRTA